MKALVIVAHGSRRAASNTEVGELACTLASLIKADYPLVDVGFLELAEPSIPQAIENVIAQGASEVAVFPYFLSAGRHVVKDVPDEVDIVREKYPDVQISMLAHLGALPDLKLLIVNALK